MVEFVVLLEVSLDMASLSRNTALLLFCCFRQAERSVHYVLSFPNEWPQFLAYYNKAKQTQIAKVISLLKDAGAELDKVPSRQELFEQNGWSAVMRCLIALLYNPLKRSWSFSRKELSFFCATLQHLLQILGHAEPRDNDELIELRMDCFDCHYVIRRKLIGIAEVRKADAIEHFSQSNYVSFVTFHDLGIHGP
jgi:hypothetical protein